MGNMEKKDKEYDDATKEKLLDQTRQFLYYLDNGKGWESCKAYCVDEPTCTFDCQCDCLRGVNTIAAYALWKQDFCNNITPGFTIRVHSCSVCMETMTVTYVATFHGKHTGPNGPVPPTQRECHTEYVYVVQLDESDNDNKVQSVKKIWNDTYARKQLGWI